MHSGAQASHNEVERRWKTTTPQEPTMNSLLQDVTRDQMMAMHQTSHLHGYAPETAATSRILQIRCCCPEALGIGVSVRGAGVE